MHLYNWHVPIFNYFVFNSKDTRLCMNNSLFAIANNRYKLAKCEETFITQQFTFTQMRFEKFESDELYFNALTRYRKVLRKCRNRKNVNSPRLAPCASRIKVLMRKQMHLMTL